MTHRTLDLIFAIGGLVVAALVLVVGLILQNQANFAENYVHDQLAAQQIYFAPADALKSNENNPCLKENAGQQLVTGKQAECANQQRASSSTGSDQRRGQGSHRQDAGPVPRRDSQRLAAHDLWLQHLR
jgi:hypothetical protein